MFNNINFRVELSLSTVQFIEPQQRFTLRKNNITIATGVFLEVLPKQSEEEKDKRYRKKLLKAEMERLGFNPYDSAQEKRCKPDYSKSETNPLAEKFKEAKSVS